MNNLVRLFFEHKIICIVLAADIVAFMPILLGHGDITLRDFNFPINPEGFRSFHFPIFNELIETSNLTSWYRLPSRLLLVLLTYFLSVSWVLKIYLFLTFFMGQCFFYLFCRSILKQPSTLLLGILTFFYTFNHRFIDFAWETSLVWAYSFIPLGLWLISKSITQKKVINRYSVFFPFFFLAAFVHPYGLVVIYGLIAFWAIFVIKNFSLITRIKHVLWMVFGSLVAAFYFIVPIVVVWMMNGPVTPATQGVYSFDYIKMIDYLSSSTLTEKITLIRSPIKIAEYLPGSLALQVVWFYFSIILYVVIPTAGLYIWRKSKQRPIETARGGLRLSVPPVVLLYLLLLVLSFGTIGLQGPLYHLILDIAPNSFEWLLRSPLKFALYAMSVLFIAFALFSSRAVSILSPRIMRQATLLLGIALAFSGFFTYKSYFIDDRLNPVHIPSQYREINQLLRAKPDTYRVLYLPRYDERETTWSGNRDISPFDLISSSKQTINYWWNDPDYKEYLYTKIYAEMQFDNICTYLKPLNIEYLVFHNDRLNERADIDTESLKILKNRYEKNIIYEKQDWYVFDLNCHDLQFFRLKPNIASQGRLAEDLRLSDTFNLLKDPESKQAYPSEQALLTRAARHTFKADYQVWTKLDDQDLKSDLLQYFDAQNVYDNKPNDTALQYLKAEPGVLAKKAVSAADVQFVGSNSLVDGQSNNFTIKQASTDDFYEIQYKLTIPRQGTIDLAKIAFDLKAAGLRGLHINYQMFANNRPLYDKQVLLTDLSLDNNQRFWGQLHGEPELYIPASADTIAIYVKGLPTDRAGELSISTLKAQFLTAQLPKDPTIFTLDTTGQVFIKILRSPNGGIVTYNSSRGQKEIDFYSSELQTDWVKIEAASNEQISFRYRNGMNYFLGYSDEHDLSQYRDMDYVTFDSSCSLFAPQGAPLDLAPGIAICQAASATNQADTNALITYFKNPDGYAKVKAIKGYYSYTFSGKGVPNSDKFGITLPLVGKKMVADKNLTQTSYLATAYAIPAGTTQKAFSIPLKSASLIGLLATLAAITLYVVCVKIAGKQTRTHYVLHGYRKRKKR